MAEQHELYDWELDEMSQTAGRGMPCNKDAVVVLTKAEDLNMEKQDERVGFMAKTLEWLGLGKTHKIVKAENPFVDDEDDEGDDEDAKGSGGVDGYGEKKNKDKQPGQKSENPISDSNFDPRGMVGMNDQSSPVEGGAPPDVSKEAANVSKQTSAPEAGQQTMEQRIKALEDENKALREKADAAGKDATEKAEARKSFMETLSVDARKMFQEHTVEKQDELMKSLTEKSQSDPTMQLLRKALEDSAVARAQVEKLQERESVAKAREEFRDIEKAVDPETFPADIVAMRKSCPEQSKRVVEKIRSLANIAMQSEVFKSFGHGGRGSSSSGPMEKLEKAAEDIRKAAIERGEKMTAEKAFSLAMDQHPGLYKEYREGVEG